MKLITKLSLIPLALASLTMAGCTNTLSHNITEKGTINNPSDLVFPKLEKAWQKAGIIPNSENLTKIRAGMKKNEIVQLIGTPHFSERQNAHEWDYIMKFYQADNSVKTCQYKILFDKDFRAQQFYWLPTDCANYYTTRTPAVVIATPIANEKINLSADALFNFNKWQPNEMKAQGREELNALAQKLIAYEKRGDSRVVITGFTDYIGDDMYNLSLSQLRAQTVRQYLIAQGVDAATMTAAGAGKSNPVKQCSANLSRADLINCLQPNRRVEVAVAIYQPK